MKVTDEINLFVNQRGTGYEQVIVDGKSVSKEVDTNTYIELLALLYCRHDEWLKLTMQGMGIQPEDAEDVFQSNSVQFVQKYDCNREIRQSFSNYFIKKMKGRYSDFVKRNVKSRVVNIGNEPILSLDEMEDVQAIEHIIDKQKREAREDEQLGGFYGTMLDFSESLVLLFRNLKKSGKKHKFFQMFYTERFLAVCRLGDYTAAIRRFKHRTELEASLDKDMIYIMYKERPGCIEEYRDFRTNTVKELDLYYNYNQPEDEKIVTEYDKILSEYRPDSELYKQNIRFPVQNDIIFVAYLFIRDNSLYKQNSDGIIKYSRASISSWRGRFNNIIKAFFNEAGVGKLHWGIV